MAKNLKQQYSQIVKLFNSMIGAHQLWELWEDAMTIFALMISNAIDKRFFDQREKEYMNLVSKYSDSELQTFLKIFAEIVNQLEADPEQDLLGDLYMSLDLGSHWHGQFFTPYNVCAMMAQAQMPTDLSFDSVKPVSVFDCACGGGALLVAAAKRAVRKSTCKASSGVGSGKRLTIAEICRLAAEQGLSYGKYVEKYGTSR